MEQEYLDLKEAFGEVFNKFDFNKVHKVFVLFDFTWCFPYEEELRVPTMNELQECCLKLINECLFQKRRGIDKYEISTGRFIVGYNEYGKAYINTNLIYSDTYYK